ncbi:Sec-independent protein translocase protein TatB [Thalassotalea ponticola]|uniref:Sec-independent protein translocase protein TatB n=1 Tax=Thalassotalea ponticola TaxID=1523392 RepID=UPI0025B40FE6|nr:Sec-independent protein translocase protein TatB [Thalassotalea ponticola]MDN3652391.1 Sec-independent protein translocase protein TatB [Thalassotalea ponticola]
MFDIGFWELTVIAVMALVVLGPERMPVAIRTVRGWVRNIKQFSSSVQTELKEELRIHELHENLRKAEQQGMKDLSPELQDSVDQLKSAAADANRPYAKQHNPLNQDPSAVDSERSAPDNNSSSHPENSNNK